VPHLVDQFIPVIHENWDILDHPTLLPAYALWRLNWIHLFIEGNGRTARAACYYLICLRNGGLLPGRRTVPERIRDNRDPYYLALREADMYWDEGQFNVDALASYLEDLLEQQLRDTWGGI
jgi:Fic family protein